MRALLAPMLLVACYRAESPAPPAKPSAPLEQPKRVRAAADPLGFLPVDSELVMHLDVVKLRRSNVWARFEPILMAKVSTALAQFRATCGFDFVPMIHTVALGLRGVGTAQTGGVLVVRGIRRTPSLECIERALAGQPALGSIQGELVTVVTAPNEPPVVFAFADERTLVLLAGHASSKEKLRGVLDSGSPLRGSLAFTEMFGRLDPQRAAWFFMNGSATAMSSLASLGIKPRAVFGSFDLATGLAAKVFVRMQDLSEAATLAQTIQNQLPAVQTFVEKFEVTAEDTDVVMDIGLTEDQVAMLVGLINP